jgi:hypothetical protein
MLDASNTSMVRLNTGNGYGSTNTKIRRFTNTVTNQGSDITYADSASLGASLTINTAGIYAISYSDASSSASLYVGLSLNTTGPTTNVWALAAGEILGISFSTTADGQSQASWTGYLPAGSVVRPHTNGLAGTTVSVNGVQFTITRVA